MRRLVVGERDRQPDAVGLGQDRAEQVAGIVVEREHRGRRLADPLALEELGVERGGVEDARVRQLLGDLARPLGAALDEAHADVAVQQHARDRRAHLPGAEDHDVVHPLLLVGHHAAPLAGGRRRADHDDPVVGLDPLLAARDGASRRRG